MKSEPPLRPPREPHSPRGRPSASEAAEINSNSRGVILVLRVTVRRARPCNPRVVMPSALPRMVIVSLNSGVLCGSWLATELLQVVCFQW